MKLILLCCLLSATAFADYYRTDITTELTLPNGTIVYQAETVVKTYKDKDLRTIDLNIKFNTTKDLTQDQKESLTEKNLSVTKFIKET